MKSKNYDFFVEQNADGERLDVWLARQGGLFSRSQISRRIEEGEVSVNGSVVKRPARRMIFGEKVQFTPQLPKEPSYAAEDIPLSILYEDMHLLVVNKPSFMVVHPAKGHESGTLVNALLHHCGEEFQKRFFESGQNLIDQDLDELDLTNEEPDEKGSLNTNHFSWVQQVQQRLGIVHRLDHGTSGLLVCAKNEQVLTKLQKQFQERTILRSYMALVFGVPPEEGKFVTPYGRHLTEPKKFTAKRGNKQAITTYRTMERYPGAALLSVRLQTGRTHQIRVHLSEAMHPLVGDPLYTHNRFVQKSSVLLSQIHKTLGHQALHAKELGFIHPVTQTPMHFEVDVPADFAHALAQLRS